MLRGSCASAREAQLGRIGALPARRVAREFCPDPISRAAAQLLRRAIRRALSGAAASARRGGDGFGVGAIAGNVGGWLACWVPPRTIFAAEAPSTAERLSVQESNESVKTWQISSRRSSELALTRSLKSATRPSRASSSPPFARHVPLLPPATRTRPSLVWPLRPRSSTRPSARVSSTRTRLRIRSRPSRRPFPHSSDRHWFRLHPV